MDVVLAGRGGDVGDNFLAWREVTAGDRHLGACAGEGAGGLDADPGRAAGDADSPAGRSIPSATSKATPPEPGTRSLSTADWTSCARQSSWSTSRSLRAKASG
jgi:hypothetical protein